MSEMKNELKNLPTFTGIFFSISLELNFRKGQANNWGRLTFLTYLKINKTAVF